MGKGKKKRKKTPQLTPPKPRGFGIAFSASVDCVIKRVSVGRDGTIVLFDEQGKRIPLATAETEVTYERGNAKGMKIVVQQPTCLDAPKIYPDANLTDYDALFAVDTNTNELSGEKVAVIAFAKLDPNGLESVFVSPWRAMEIRNPVGNPERIGWRIACQSLHLPTRKIGLVVDSEMGLIPSINARVEPVERDFFIPENIHLIYASADASPASVANYMIRACDSTAAHVMRQIVAGDVSSPLEPAPPDEKSFSHFRLFRGVIPL